MRLSQSWRKHPDSLCHSPCANPELRRFLSLSLSLSPPEQRRSSSWTCGWKMSSCGAPASPPITHGFSTNPSASVRHAQSPELSLLTEFPPDKLWTARIKHIFARQISRLIFLFFFLFFFFLPPSRVFRIKKNYLVHWIPWKDTIIKFYQEQHEFYVIWHICHMMSSCQVVMPFVWLISALWRGAQVKCYHIINRFMKRSLISQFYNIHVMTCRSTGSVTLIHTTC